MMRDSNEVKIFAHVMHEYLLNDRLTAFQRSHLFQSTNLPHALRTHTLIFPAMPQWRQTQQIKHIQFFFRFLSIKIMLEFFNILGLIIMYSVRFFVVCYFVLFMFIYLVCAYLSVMIFKSDSYTCKY